MLPLFPLEVHPVEVGPVLFPYGTERRIQNKLVCRGTESGKARTDTCEIVKPNRSCTIT